MSQAQDPLSTWTDLNTCLLTATQETCEDLLQRELLGRCRLNFLMRIHSRINKVRADAERAELRRKHAHLKRASKKVPKHG